MAVSNKKELKRTTIVNTGDFGMLVKKK